MNITINQIEQIIEKATWAPSGDNCQPWTFEWDGNYLSIFHHADRAQHPLDPSGIASKLSLGCLLTALDLAASEFQLTTSFKTFDMNYDQISIWAQVEFKKSDRTKNNLVDRLHHRTTDRRIFKTGQLDSNLFKDLNNFEKVRMHVVSKPSAKLINYIVQAEQLLLDHPKILPSTLEWVRFTTSQARKTNDGMLWRNMEIKFWELPMIPILRDVRNAVKVLAPLIRPQNKIRVRQQLQSASGLICVSIPQGSLNHVVDAGRLMMLIWLTLNQSGYGVQPFTITSTISFCIRHGLFSAPNNWVQYFTENKNIIPEEFSIPDQAEAIWMIRTGPSSPLPANSRTLRKPVSEILKIKGA